MAAAQIKARECNGEFQRHGIDFAAVIPTGSPPTGPDFASRKELFKPGLHLETDGLLHDPRFRVTKPS